jgi:hypothetical protein
VFAVALLASGCGGPPHSAQPFSVLRANEIEWVRSYAQWIRSLSASVQQAESIHRAILGGHSSKKAYAEAVGRVEGCSDSYRDTVGLPPSKRLRSAAALVIPACRGFARGERLQLDALGHAPGAQLFAGESAIDHAGLLFLTANQRLEAKFLWNEDLPTLGGVKTVSRIEPLFGRVATALTNGPVEVRCWSRRDWPRVVGEFRAWSGGTADLAGFAIFASRGINLDPWACEHLARFAYLHRFPRGSRQLDMAWAVQILSHEIQHLVSPASEAATECYGVQNLAQVARALGATRPYARTLAVRYWNEGYPAMPPKYRTKLCRNDGPLDANRASASWP